MARGVRSASTRHRHHALNHPAVNNGLERTITDELRHARGWNRQADAGVRFRAHAIVDIGHVTVTQGNPGGDPAVIRIENQRIAAIARCLSGSALCLGVSHHLELGCHFACRVSRTRPAATPCRSRHPDGLWRRRRHRDTSVRPRAAAPGAHAIPVTRCPAPPVQSAEQRRRYGAGSTNAWSWSFID